MDRNDIYRFFPIFTTKPEHSKIEQIKIYYKFLLIFLKTLLLPLLCRTCKCIEQTDHVFIVCPNLTISTVKQTRAQTHKDRWGEKQRIWEHIWVVNKILETENWMDRPELIWQTEINCTLSCQCRKLTQNKLIWTVGVCKSSGIMGPTYILMIQYGVKFNRLFSLITWLYN